MVAEAGRVKVIGLMSASAVACPPSLSWAATFSVTGWVVVLCLLTCKV